MSGRLCHGGEWHEEGGTLTVVPRDGVRRRFHARLDGRRLDLTLRSGRFVAIRLGADGSIAGSVEGRAGGPHEVVLDIAGVGHDRCRISTATGSAVVDLAGGSVTVNLPGFGPSPVAIVPVV